MSQVYNPEAEIIAEIEKLELESRDLRRRLARSQRRSDQMVLQKQIEELQTSIDHLRGRLP